MRGHENSKSRTCTEITGVYPADIGVEVGAHYPGRSVDLPCASAAPRRCEGSTEVSRGHSRSEGSTDRRAEQKMRKGNFSFDECNGARKEG